MQLLHAIFNSKHVQPQVRLLQHLAGVLLCLWAVTGNAAPSPEPIRFGLFPSLIPRTLIGMYEPMRKYVETAVGRPVQLFSSPDFISFARRTSQSDYDIVLTAPHLAYLAANNDGYTPVACYKNGIKTILVVRRKDAAMPPERLRGKVVAIPDPEALVTYVGQDMLREHGLQPERDYTLLRARGHQGAAMAVVQGNADMAFMGAFPFNQLSDEIKARISVYAESPVYPAQYFLVSQRLSPATRKAVQQALIRFSRTREGRELIAQSQFGDIVPANVRDLNVMRSIAAQVQEELQHTN